jgi:hypothetical protein
MLARIEWMSSALECARRDTRRLPDDVLARILEAGSPPAGTETRDGLWLHDLDKELKAAAEKEGDDFEGDWTTTKASDARKAILPTDCMASVNSKSFEAN